MPALKEKETKLSYVPVLSVALKDAEMAAFSIMNDAFRNMFAERVRNSEIGRIVSDTENFEGASVRYDKAGEEDLYSVEVTIGKKSLILGLRVGENSTEMILMDSEGREMEYLRQKGREIEVRR
jgi:hypothetical protein